MDELAHQIRQVIAEEVTRQLEPLLRALEDKAEMRLGALRGSPARMTVRQAAYATNRHPDTVLKACQRGDLVASQRTAGGKWSILREDLAAWMDRRPAGR